MFPDRFLVGLGDGSVRWVSKKVSEATLRHAIVANDGNPLGSDWDELVVPERPSSKDKRPALDKDKKVPSKDAKTGRHVPRTRTSSNAPWQAARRHRSSSEMRILPRQRHCTVTLLSAAAPCACGLVGHQ